MESLEEAAQDVEIVVDECSDGTWLKFASCRGYPRPHLMEYMLRHASAADQKKIEKVLTLLPDARQYLMYHQTKFPGASLLAHHGTDFPTKDWGECSDFLPESECYRNSIGTTLTHPGVLYAEGICVHPSGVDFHAWNIQDGYVLDRTWPMSHLNKYLGTVFEPHWLAKKGFPYGYVWARWKEAEKALKELFAQDIR